MLIHFYSYGSKIGLYEDPRPEPGPGRYLGEVELSPAELSELKQMVSEAVEPPAPKKQST
jgi:hypothetical protein